MSSVTIWHNPRCSKSRQTLALLTEQQIQPTIVEYLKAAPSEAEIRHTLELLGISAKQMMRTKETEFKEQNLSDADEASLISAMHNTPKLIERPIVFANGKAAIGRPPEAVLEIL